MGNTCSRQNTVTCDPQGRTLASSKTAKRTRTMPLRLQDSAESGDVDGEGTLNGGLTPSGTRSIERASDARSSCASLSVGASGNYAHLDYKGKIGTNGRFLVVKTIGRG